MLETLQNLDPSTYLPADGGGYPPTEFGAGLKQIALLVKADVVLEVAAIDLGNWDMHFAQGGSHGLMANLARGLAEGLGATFNDLSEQLGRFTLLVMTEFGCRASENASLGTDHGHGALTMLLGGNVNGGAVHGVWPGPGATFINAFNRTFPNCSIDYGRLIERRGLS